MVARLSITILLIATLGALAAACGGSDKPPAQIPPDQVKATLRANIPLANTPTSFTTRPVSDDEAIWDEIAARVSGNVSPILRPPAAPEGFDTVRAGVSDSFFNLEYTGPSKTLRMNVGMLSNPEMPTDAGHQEIVQMRGIDCVEGSKEKICPLLQVRNDANPKESSFLIWCEPGREVISEGPTRDSVEYLLSEEGVEPQFLIDFAKSLVRQ